MVKQTSVIIVIVKIEKEFWWNNRLLLNNVNRIFCKKVYFKNYLFYTTIKTNKS